MVNRKRSYTLHFLLLAVLTSVALATVNYLAMQYRARLDLTADQRFTLSEGTQRLFESLTDKVEVTYFVDEEPPPKRINLERDVRDKLQELAASSGGKLTFTIERISVADASSKREELEKRKIAPTMELLTSGVDDAARAKGFQGYYSSAEVKYGLSEPMVIKDIRNLVDRLDESAEHRVDTLEFDICFSVLQMRSKGTTAPIKRLVKSLREPLVIRGHFSQQMPADNPKLAETIGAAMKELAAAGGGNVSYDQNQIGFGMVPTVGNRPLPYGMETKEETVDPLDPSRKGPKYYFAFLEVEHKERIGVIYDFSAEKTNDAVLEKVSKLVNEIVKTPTKLGFILPPGDIDPRRQQPGQPPQTSYNDAVTYMQQTFGYESELIDLGAQKRIPRDLAVLIAFEPNKYPERELYEIDRYLAEGGNVVMLYQGWEARIEAPMGRFKDNLALNKAPTLKHFEDWCRFHGIEFGQDAIFDKGGSMAPYTRTRAGVELMPSNVPLAVVVEPGDVNSDSIYGRSLAGMPLPFPVAIKLNDKAIEDAKLERQDVIALKDDVYRFIPANPAFPEIPMRLNMESASEVEIDPAATPGAAIRFQRTTDPVLVATSLRGTFGSFWASGGRKVPAWANPPAEGDPVAGKQPPALKSRPGSLLLCSSAGTLNIDYLWGYEYSEAVNVVIPKGCTFFKNMAETHIYGEDLVRLRVRTGVSPRIAGEVSEGRRLWWLLVCLAGVPVALLMFGVGRNLLQAKARQEYEAAIGAGAKE